LDQSDDAERWKVVTGPRKRRSAKGGVLGDHRRVGKRFVPPFVAMLGQLQYVKWIDDLLPEVLWLGMLNNDHGLRRGVQLAKELSTAADRVMAPHPHIFARTSTYSSIPSEQWPKIVELITSTALDQLRGTLRPFVVLYPECPFYTLWLSDQPQPQADDVVVMRTQVGTLRNRANRPAMLAQANAIYLARVTGKLILNQGSFLSNFEAIADYPDAEESRMVGSAIRAASMMLGHNTEEPQEAAGKWTRYFWQRGIEITACDLGINGDDDG
jgi:hypothetical protein